MSSTPETLAWAAGVFDARGTITHRRGKPRLVVKSSDRALLERFHDAIRFGRVYGPYGPYASSVAVSSHHLWVAEGDAGAAIRVLMPWLGPAARARAYDVFHGQNTFGVETPEEVPDEQ